MFLVFFCMLSIIPSALLIAQDNSDNDRNLDVTRLESLFNEHTKELKSNDNKGLKYLNKLSNMGCGESSFLLGIHYEYGDRVKKDEKIALKFFLKAITQKHKAAYINAARLLLQDNQKQSGLKLLEDGKEKSLNIKAFLGEVLYYGKYNIQPQLTKGKALLKAAALKSHIEANFLLGEILKKEGSLNISYKYYKLAADKNHPIAALQLSKFYKHGYGGVEVDLKKEKYYRKKSTNTVAFDNDGKVCRIIER